MSATSATTSDDRPVSIGAVARGAIVRWFESDAPGQSAALAFYTLLSLAPVLLVVTAIGGAIFGETSTHVEIERQIRILMGPDVAATVTEVLAAADRPKLSGWAGVGGLFALVLGATAVFSQLQGSLNAVWNVEPKPGNLFTTFLTKRLLSFGLILVIGFLLLVSLMLSTGLAAFGAHLERRLAISAEILAGVNFGLFFVLISGLFGLIFFVLPDARLRWRDCMIGGAATAMLFSIGKLLIGLYLGRSAIASVYGVAGSVVLMLLWIYYSSMVLLLGAGFTRGWAERRGRGRIAPELGARRQSDPEPSP